VLNKYYPYILIMLFFCAEASAQNNLGANKWLDFVISGVDFKASIKVLDTSLYYLAKSEDVSSQKLTRAANIQVVRKLDAYTNIIKFKSFSPAMVESIKLYKTNDQWKVSPNIQGSTLDQGFTSYFIKTSTQDELINLINTQGYSFNAISKNLIQLLCPAEFITKIIALPSVSYVGKESVLNKIESTVLDLNLVPNGVTKVHHEYPNLTGEGLTLSIKEGLYNLSDIDLRGRHIPSKLQAEVTNNHSTDMATIAAGAGNSSPNGKGVATGANITSSDFSNIFPDRSENFEMLNAWVQNHSYGTEIENFYGILAQAYDQSTNSNPKLLHLFSVGNQGEQTNTSGKYQALKGFATLTGNYKMSKNTLSIGSVDTVGRPMNFVSRGPAYDGRIKPELVSYSVNGSSNSTALVSGMALLLQQQYQNQFQQLPPSALIKALLINSAEDVAAVGIDYTTGFGNLNAFRTLENMKANQFFSGEVSEGDMKEFDVDIPVGVINIKVTLVWNDPAAEVNANIALVNDLDLSIASIDGKITLPWTLDENPNGLLKPAVRKKDHLNNVEQVSIPYSTSEKLTVRINGFSLQKGPQKFHVAYQWDDPDSFTWNFPTGSDNMPYNGETVGYFRWKSTLDQQVGKLFYSTDDGITWNLIEDQIDLTKGYYRWEAPKVNATAKAKISIDGQEFITDKFTISLPHPISVGFICGDSIRLQWGANKSAVSYELMTFGKTALQTQKSTTDSSITFFRSDFETPYFSIQPVLKDGARLMRSITTNLDFQGIGCYLTSLSPENAPEEGVYLNINLGTTVGIEEIDIERKNNLQRFEKIDNIPKVKLRNGFRFLDSSPLQGLNQYRLKLKFQNGEEYLSAIAETYFLTTRPFLVFPNPVSNNEPINIFSKVFEQNQVINFLLFDITGTKVFQETLYSDSNSVQLGPLKNGVYIYHLSLLNYIMKGKIIIE
jgi:hypothetical protein